VTVGMTAAVANAILEAQYKGSSYSGNADVYTKLHTGDPGSAGTSNASAETTRKQLTFGTASGGSLAASEVTWSSWAAGAETISHVSYWTAATAGTFLGSGALSSSKSMSNGDSLGITVTATQGPIAA
jgi:hypothetical protein